MASHVVRAASMWGWRGGLLLPRVKYLDACVWLRECVMAGSGEAVPLSRLKDEGRVGALRETRLSAASAAGMERFARLAAELVGVPVALVSLVEPARQVFPGMVGLADPWAESRPTPLTHSLCQHVVAEARPLV
ncbi:hypothetical protein [Streptomyces microflavus]|uniref:hypothetical protein n=1 Tax=Streptomyces microflavus TaxID=1919 RepID=UPI00365E5ACA